MADGRADYKCRLWFGILLFLGRSGGGRMPGLIINVVFGLVFCCFFAGLTEGRCQG